MTERTLTTKLMATLKRGLRGTLILKHSDRWTNGIPDLSVSYLGSTFWFEIKFLRRGRKLTEIIDGTQTLVCHQLENTTGRCWFVVYEEHPKRTSIWQPRILGAIKYPKLLGVGKKTFDYGNLDAVVGLNLPRLLQNHGSVRFDGWLHEAVVKLVTDHGR